MKSSFFLVHFLLFLAIAPSFAQKKGFDPEAKIKVDLLKKDFHILHSAIGLGHPAWGQYHSLDSMEIWFRQTGAQIQEDMTEVAFRQLLDPLIAKMGCGHTRLQNSKAFVKYQRDKDKAELKRRYPPVKAFWVGDQLFVGKVTSADSNQIIIGTEILAIDGRNASEIIQTLSKRITSDGYNQTYRRRAFNVNFDAYYRFYYGEKNQYEMKLRTPSGDTTLLNVQANQATLKERRALINRAKANRLKKGTTVLQKKGYQLQRLPDNPKLALMDIRGFRQRRGKGFYKKAFKYLNQKNIDTLVLDLRDNGGGAVKDAGRLLSYFLHQPNQLIASKKRKKSIYEKYLGQKFLYNFIVPILVPFNFKNQKTETELIHSARLKPRKKNHFDGELYVLVNGRTFSASVLVAAYLAEEKRATFIGQETGGGLSGTNAFLMPKLELPNTGMRMVFPLYTIQHQISAKNIGRGLMPDHELTYTLEDLLEDRDLELEKLLEMQRQKYNR